MLVSVADMLIYKMMVCITLQNPLLFAFFCICIW